MSFSISKEDREGLYYMEAAEYLVSLQNIMRTPFCDNIARYAFTTAVYLTKSVAAPYMPDGVLDELDSLRDVLAAIDAYGAPLPHMIIHLAERLANQSAYSKVLDAHNFDEVFEVECDACVEYTNALYLAVNSLRKKEGLDVCDIKAVFDESLPLIEARSDGFHIVSDGSTR